MTSHETTPVLLLTGPPGAGKTTTARILADHSERAVHLEADFFFHSIRTGYIAPWKPESRAQNTTVMSIIGAAAAAYADAGYFTIIDGIIIPGWFLEPLRDSLHQAGHKVAYAVVRAPLAVCVARARSRDSQPLPDTAVVGRLWQTFANLGPLEANVFNTGTNKPDQTADQLAASIRTGSLLL